LELESERGRKRAKERVCEREKAIVVGKRERGPERKKIIIGSGDSGHSVPMSQPF